MATDTKIEWSDKTLERLVNVLVILVNVLLVQQPKYSFKLLGFVWVSVFLHPSENEFGLFGTVTRHTGGNYVVWSCIPTSANGNKVIERGRGFRAVSTLTAEPFVSVFDSFRCHWQYVSSSAASMLLSFYFVDWVCFVPLAVLLSNVRFANSMTHVSYCKPIFANPTPCEAVSRLRCPFCLGWPVYSSGIIATAANCVQAIAARFINTKVVARSPCFAFVTPLLPTTEAFRIFVKTQTDTFGGNFHNTVLIPHNASILLN